MFLELLLAVLLAGCLASAVVPVIRGRKLARASQAWPRVRGQITSVDHPVGGPFALPQVEYEYRVDGKLYLGSAVAFGLPQNARELTNKHFQVGEVVWVQYEPEKPARAVLYPGGSALRKLLGEWPALLNLVFSGVLSILFVLLLLRDLLG